MAGPGIALGDAKMVTRGLPLKAYLDRPSSSPLHIRLLPLGVIWPGFAVNTLFYATILWLLIFGPPVGYAAWQARSRRPSPV